MATEIKKVSTGEQNISKRSVTYDVYLNGQYLKSFDDVIKALDFVESIEGGSEDAV